MVKARISAGLVAGCVLVCSHVAFAAVDPNVTRMLSFRPKQEGVVYTTPAAQEQENCKVEQIVDKPPGTRGWLLRDGRGLPLRRFLDTNGDKHLDVSSYYLDGVEVYREIDTNFNRSVDQYRWLNAGGMKWGVDHDEDGKIDYWKMISPEEVSQEILQAVATKDFARLQALFISDPELKSLDMPATEIKRIHDLRQQAQVKFEKTVAKSGLSAQTRWERLECTPPQCNLAEQSGTKRDLIKYQRGIVLYENSGKHDWLQTGEMIQIGLAWRIIDAPVPGDTPTGGDQQPVDPALQALLDELRQLDAESPKGQEIPSANAALVSYNIRRANLLERIIAKVKAEDRDQWVRQVADCLSAAAQSSPENDRSAYERLQKLEQEIVKNQGDSPLAAYVTFREMSADYAGKLGKPGPEFAKVQEQWLIRLAKFVQDYAKAEDTPDALLQLGMVSEFLGKEIEASKWYRQLATNFGDKKLLADKANGALRRLELEGKVLELSGSTLTGQTFDISSLRGKTVVVYYWASWNQQSVGDFARLKLLLNNYATKGLELVCINLDNSPPEASSALASASAPGTQLFQAGGLDSPLAVQYGIMVLPNMLLVDKEGKVASRNVQIANLEDEIKKLIK